MSLILSPKTICEVCKEQLNADRKPALIPCDHAFCTECLEGILKTRPIGAPCPSCREPFTPANIRKIRVRTSNSSISSSDSSKSDYIKTRQDMQIRVKELSDRTTSYDVRTSDTVADLKAQIKDKCGIPPDQQRLLWCGKQLEDGHTLEYYNLRNDSVIHLVLRMRGGV